MNARFALIMLAILVAVIGGVAFFFSLPSATQGPLPGSGTATTTPGDGDDQSLSARVSVTSPLPNSNVEKTFTVTGKAPGPWYFEASFPVQVRDKDSNLLGSTHAQAHGDWMTTGLVPFSAAIALDTTYKGPATLVLLKDNPSGLPQNDDSVSIPIVIK